MEAKGNTVGNNYLGGSFNSVVSAPFIGTYLVATKGGFFADVLLRGEYYQTQLDSPSLNIFNQKLNAHGVSVATSVGYNYPIPNSNWFVEPSAGFIYSHTSVDAFNTAGVPLVGSAAGIQGTVQINDIDSEVGRAGVRVGTTINSGAWVIQPFAAASVWHEFGKPTTATYTDCTNCAVLTNWRQMPRRSASTYTGTSVGTYGQYSVGVSGALVNTGWVAFARFDYRDGQNLQGWDATGGVRYHFTPGGDPNRAIVAKAPVQLRAPVNWTGVYVGVCRCRLRHGQDELSPVSLRMTRSGAGFLGGVSAGYNRQFGQVGGRCRSRFRLDQP